jgi:hypothetical protein
MCCVSFHHPEMQKYVSYSMFVEMVVGVLRIKLGAGVESAGRKVLSRSCCDR